MSWARYVLVLVILPVVIVACKQKDEIPDNLAVSTHDYAVPIVKQAVSERIWQRFAIRELYSLPSVEEEDVVLFNPSGLVTDSRSNVYVMDYGDMQLKAFDPEGRFLRSYGNGPGEGPGEFTQVMDYAVFRDSVLYVVDSFRRRISYFALDGRFLDSESTELGFVRYEKTASGRSYGMSIGSEFLFATGNDAGIVRFGTVLKNQAMEDAIRLSGNIATYRGDLVYSSDYFPIVLRYDSTGSLVYARATPDYGDHVPVSVERRTFSGGVSFLPDGERKYVGITVIRDRFYVRVLGDPTAFDIYDARTGEYESSIAMPSRGHYFVTPERAYQVKDTTVVVYAIDQAQ